MLLEKCENLLDLFARQLLIHLSLASYISLGETMIDALKNQMLMLFTANFRHYSYPARVIQV